MKLEELLELVKKTSGNNDIMLTVKDNVINLDDSVKSEALLELYNLGPVTMANEGEPSVYGITSDVLKDIGWPPLLEDTFPVSHVTASMGNDVPETAGAVYTFTNDTVDGGFLRLIDMFRISQIHDNSEFTIFIPSDVRVDVPADGILFDFEEHRDKKINIIISPENPLAKVFFPDNAQE
jgi:hypothetical protein